VGLAVALIAGRALPERNGNYVVVFVAGRFEAIVRVRVGGLDIGRLGHAQTALASPVRTRVFIRALLRCRAADARARRTRFARVACNPVVRRDDDGAASLTDARLAGGRVIGRHFGVVWVVRLENATFAILVVLAIGGRVGVQDNVIGNGGMPARPILANIIGAFVVVVAVVSAL
jgi:hypothetical protein